MKELDAFKIQDWLLTSDEQDIDCCIELFFAYLEWKIGLMVFEQKFDFPAIVVG